MGFGLQVFHFQHVFAEDYDYLAGGYSSTMVTVICAVCIVYIWSLSPALPVFPGFDLPVCHLWAAGVASDVL